MKKNILIDQTVKKIHQLPEWRIKEVSDFVEFLLQKKESQELSSHVSYLNSQSDAFDFLKEEEDLYNDADIIKG